MAVKEKHRSKWVEWLTHREEESPDQVYVYDLYELTKIEDGIDPDEC